MLLTQLIDQQQQSYSNIQIQIEALQEQQRQIQAHLQRLGSVESQMVSAVQVMSEAIASINEVCPGEMTSYKDLIYGLFNTPLAALPGNDNDPEPDPTPDPSVELVPEEVSEEEAIEVTVVAVSEHETLMQEVTVKVDSMSYAQIRQELAARRLNNKGNHAALKDRLIDHYKTLDVVELTAINSWDPTQKAA